VRDKVHDGFDKVMDELVSVKTQLAQLSKNEHLADLEWRMKGLEDVLQGVRKDINLLTVLIVVAAITVLLALTPIVRAILSAALDN
jgi:hypothetical protein